MCWDLDVKDGKDGLTAFRELVQDHEDYPFVVTPSGGEHIWVARPKGGAGNAEGALPKGINIRCDAGYVCFGELADGTRYDADDIIVRLLDDKPWPAMPAVIAEALKSTRKTSDRSAGNDYQRYGKSLVTFEEARRVHKPLRMWSGNQGPDQGPSGQFASLAETTINAMLEIRGCALEDIAIGDACMTVHEIMSAFLEHADSDAAALANEHMARRGPYSIAKLIEKSEPDRAPEEVKTVRAFEKLRTRLNENAAQTGDQKTAKPKELDTQAGQLKHTRLLRRPYVSLQ